MFHHAGFFALSVGRDGRKLPEKRPMNNSGSIMAQCPGESSLPVQLAHIGSGEEHVALLVDPRRFGLLRRWDDLFDDGVAAVFGLVGEEAELMGLCFHAGKFTRTESATWLAERGFTLLLFVPSSSSLAAANFDAPQATLFGRAVSWNNKERQ